MYFQFQDEHRQYVDIPNEATSQLKPKLEHSVKVDDSTGFTHGDTKFDEMAFMAPFVDTDELVNLDIDLPLDCCDM